MKLTVPAQPPAAAEPTPPRNILIYTHALAGGGAERVCAILATGFAQRGCTVTLAVDNVSADNASFVDPRVRVEVLGRGHARSVWRLARLLGRERPDMSLSAIGVSNLKHSVAAALAGRLRHAVLSYHAFAVSEPQLLSRLGYWSTPLLSRLTARTVAVSHVLRRDLVKRWRAAADRTVTIHNPVVIGDASSTAPRPGARPLVLAAGRLTPGKNMRGLVRAFARVAAERDADLVILGEGPDRAALEADIAALGLADRVELPGYVAEPWDYYRRAACFVTASEAESFSMVVAEALAYGLPVVATDSAGPREVLEDGHYGSLVPAGDTARLADAIVRALDQPGDAEARMRRGRSFSVEAGVDAYARLAQDIAA